MLIAGKAVAARGRSRTITGELALIDAIRRQAGAGLARLRAVRLGIGDDCAILRPSAGYEICVTTDFTLEDRHFRRAWHPPESVGHRCLARGLSDLAAMGAKPLAVFLSLAIPASLEALWVKRFLNGFLALARTHHVALAGGDTAESPSMAKGEGLILADVVAVGETPQGKALPRSGARAGDRIYVTGALGGAAAELDALAKGPRKFARITRAEAGHPHLYPEPRVAVGLRLRGLATAAIDVSDGLTTDLTHLCEESGVTAVLEESALPIHRIAMARRDRVDLAVNGGEDYELLFTAPARARVPQKIAGVAVHEIGVIRKDSGRRDRISMQATDGRAVGLRPAGFEHFRQTRIAGSYQKS